MIPNAEAARLTVPSVTTTTINIQWTAEIGSFVSYQLSYAPANGDQVSLPVFGSNAVKQTTLTSLTPGLLYALALHTVTAGGVTSLSDSTEAVTRKLLEITTTPTHSFALIILL